jgi:hypothetical protein
VHELVNLSSQLVVLMRDHPDVIVHAVDFHLQICIRLDQCAIRVLSRLKFSLHIHDLIFLLPYLSFHVLNLCRQVDVLAPLRVYPALYLRIFLLVAKL